MAGRTKTDEPTEVGNPTELTVEEIKMLYQLATQASIRVVEIGKVYNLIQKTERYINENLK
jgi:hypothetical protein